MNIEVTGTGTHNKGAELMLVSIVEHYMPRKDVHLAVDQFFGTYEERIKYGLWQKMQIPDWGRSRLAAMLMPPSFRKAFGLLTDEDIDVLMDASGFAFGDQHPVDRTARFAELVENSKKNGKKVILLPQAFGPFESPELRTAFARIVKAADLVFARDDDSLEFAEEAAGKLSHLRIAPDFTNLVTHHEKRRDTEKNNKSKRVCIIPNQQMLNKAESNEDAQNYLPLLGRCIKVAEEKDLEPVIVLHGADDTSLVPQLQNEVGHELKIHKEDDPVSLKKYLGESHLVVGSRFHALIGALSQGVPAIATSWSHKYEKLFQDYQCEDLILAVPSDEHTIRLCFEKTLGDNRNALVERLHSQGEKLIQQSNSMWKQVDDILFNNN